MIDRTFVTRNECVRPVCPTFRMSDERSILSDTCRTHVGQNKFNMFYVLHGCVRLSDMSDMFFSKAKIFRRLLIGCCASGMCQLVDSKTGTSSWLLSGVQTFANAVRKAHSPIIPAAFARKSSRRRKYRLSTSMLRCPVWDAIRNSPNPASPAAVMNPLRSEWPQ